MRAGREGLGADSTPKIRFYENDPSRKRKAEVLQKTRERYSQAE